jgi:hypothetical protein
MRQRVSFRSLAAAQLWKACKVGHLDGVQAVVNNTPQDQRAALLNPDTNVKPGLTMG